MQKEFAAFIGIDWADRKHDVCLAVPGSTKLERLVLEHRPAAIRAWAEPLPNHSFCLRPASGRELGGAVPFAAFCLNPLHGTGSST